ncbi:MAG TPA: hypothetical protein VIL42_10735 [Sphingomicrobium sp.]|jgi:hypothetical protein
MNEFDVAAKFLPLAPGLGVWSLVFLAIITLIKGWPALTKLKNESDGSLRQDLLKRVAELESQQRIDRAQFEEDMRAERKSCDDRLRDQEDRHKQDIAELNGKVDALMRTIAQNSQSRAHLIGDLRRERPE